MDERVWRLPGPHGFVRDIVAEHARGRHVTTVLPEVLASDVKFTDGLAVAVQDEFARQSEPIRRIYGAGPDVSILDTFNRALIFDDLPVTVAELLCHPQAADTVAMVVARDLDPIARSELPGFLERVARESHARIGQAQRLFVIAILTRDQLPAFRGGANSDVAMTSIWWWARIARWDVAAHIAGLTERVLLQGVLADVRAESVVEIARWDLDLAEHLMMTWDGEPSRLPSLLKDWRCGSAPVMTGGRSGLDGLQPPSLALPAWDQRIVEGWHDRVSVATYSLADEPERLSRLVWAAQARVLLPWIEERRSTLHIRVTEILGAPRLGAILREWFKPSVDADELVEIGALDTVIRKALGSRHSDVRDASRQLREARNHLAHMRPLSLGDQESLQAACQILF